MRKILLTSTGFENDNIKNKFIEMLPQTADRVKILFIITAAQDPESVRVLSGCLEDLSKCNIPDRNITIYDMHAKLPQDELNKYDAIYVCGGSTDYLVRRMDEINFKGQISDYLDNGGIYIGVSAGTKAVSGHYPNSFNLLPNRVAVHCLNGTTNGSMDSNADANVEIRLTDNQAIFVDGKNMTVFE